MYHWAMGNALCGFQPFDEWALKILYRSLHQLNPEKMVPIVIPNVEMFAKKNRPHHSRISIGFNPPQNVEATHVSLNSER